MDTNTIRCSIERKKITTWNIQIANLKRYLDKQQRIKQHNKEDAEIKQLKQDTIKLANSKNILCAIGDNNIRLIKDYVKMQNDKYMIDTILKLDINNKLLQTCLLKNFKLNSNDCYNKSEYEISRTLLLQTQEYLQAI